MRIHRGQQTVVAAAHPIRFAGAVPPRQHVERVLMKTFANGDENCVPMYRTEVSYAAKVFGLRLAGEIERLECALADARAREFDYAETQCVDCGDTQGWTPVVALYERRPGHEFGQRR
jgi:hypothetical protein